MRRWVVPLATLAMVVSACAGGPGAEGADSPTTTAVVSSTTEPPPTTIATSSTTTTIRGVDPGLSDVDETLAEHATWFLEVLSTGELTEEDYQRRFSDGFREQIPYETLAPSLTPLVTEGWAVTEVVSEEPHRLVATIAPPAGEPTLRLTVGVNSDGIMEELSAVVPPETELENPPQSLAETRERLAEYGDVTFLAAEIVDGSCEVIEERAADRQIPLASTFKLWVLVALADAIEAGEVSWDETLTLTDDIKSLPSGRLQNEDPGTEVTVEETALAMISISDNTATDMIIDLLGRGAIEESLTRRMTSPGATLPFLTTPGDVHPQVR